MDGYGGEFYDDIDGMSLDAASAIAPWIVDAMSPGSVLDVGCGRGAWLAAFKRCGIDDVVGIDGDHVDRSSLHIPPGEFRAVDLLDPPTFDRDFDLVISLEVAEHLPPAVAATFVRFLTSAAPVVLFSAAIPGQGGVHHVNEQWPSYWAGRFRALGYQPIDAVRPQFWTDQRVAYFYAQNTIVYARTDVAPDVAARLGARFDPCLEPLALVHPGMLEAAVEQARARRASPPSLSKLLKQLPGASRRALGARAPLARG